MRNWRRRAFCWRGRGAASQLEGGSGQVRREEADRHRRALCRNQGARRRFLDVAGEVQGRGDRLAQAGSLSRHRSRNSPGLRGRGFRRRIYPRAQEPKRNVSRLESAPRDDEAHSITSSETAWRGSGKLSLALPARMATALGWPIAANLPAASSSAYCLRFGATGEPIRIQAA